MKTQLLFLLLLLNLTCIAQQKINRRAVVERHTVSNTKIDTLSSLSVGNGRFAFTVDITGLQSFPTAYEKGVPLGTQAEWGWHSFADTVGYKREEALKAYHLNGRDITYAVQWNTPQKNKEAVSWFRQNPHRLQLGNIGFTLIKKDGSTAVISDVQNINQQLNMWTGEIKSHFTLEGVPVDVVTYCHQQDDVIGVSIQSPLISQGRLKISLRYPYPTGEWTDVGTNYNNAVKHQSSIIQNTPLKTSLLHQLDTTNYITSLSHLPATLTKAGDHYYTLAPAKTSDTFTFSCRFNSTVNKAAVPAFAEIKQSSATGLNRFWTTGGAIDFSGSTDKRAFELERRIILSRYLIRIQETGANPPQETGLTYNSWYGKPHMEMAYWHLAHYAFWGQKDLLDQSMTWYFSAANKAKAIAVRQGYEGVRWQKMTDNNGDEAPSSVGAFLIWQQPHLIYFAETLYRDKNDVAVLNKYKDLVFATADFMASYPYYEKENDRYILGKGVIPAQERFKAEETFNPTYELVYWHWGLNIAQQWKERLGLQRDKKWDDVLQKLSKLPLQNNMYLATESATDSYTNAAYKTDHPSVLGALGMLPLTGQVDTAVMGNTFNWVFKNWDWQQTWGWDFAMVAMTATRLGLPEKAMEALLMKVQTNTYLHNGHNYQDERLRIYLPGNGGLLTAIALMCAGYDGCTQTNPGIPKNGKWQVKWEGLKKLP